MAIGFLACAVPDTHIDFLAANPGLVHAYLAGEPPSPETGGQALPSWWPTRPPECLDAWNINHRNTGLYHWMLNGSAEPQSGAGSLFQTWHDPDFPSSFLKLDAGNERFAFHADQLPELRRLVQAVDLPRVMTAFRDWLLSQGNTWAAENAVDEMACGPFVEEFKRFDELLDGAIGRKLGLVW